MLVPENSRNESVVFSKINSGERIEPEEILLNGNGMNCRKERYITQMKPVIESMTGAILRHSNEEHNNEKEELSLIGEDDISMAVFINIIQMDPNSRYHLR